MASFRNGDHQAAGRLVELFYPELRRIAAARMRAERPDHTLAAHCAWFISSISSWSRSRPCARPARTEAR